MLASVLLATAATPGHAATVELSVSGVSPGAGFVLASLCDGGLDQVSCQRGQRLLAEAGYRHHGDCNDDDLPYLERFGAAEIVAIPLTMDINDLPSAIRYGNNARVMLQQFEDAFAAARGRFIFNVMVYL